MKNVAPQHVDDFTIGIDIENVDRFEKLDRITDKVFLGNIFTKNELRYCFSKKNSAEALAGRFSAKESIAKALSALGVRSLKFTNIEILNDTDGLPKVTVGGKDLSEYHIKVSISHTKEMVVAAAIVAKKLCKKIT